MRYEFEFINSTEAESESISETLVTEEEKEGAESIASYTSEGNVAHMLETLPLMGKGMLGIFVVTALIILSVVLLNKLTQGKDDK